jgi:peptidoglycan/xylan/chitin deacetylase (PgdA/CDA1 family)
LPGTLTISLDFELHWGGFEKWHLGPTGHSLPGGESKPKGYQQYFLNTREVIPEMLALFRNYEVHVTWATVGMLFHKSKEALLNNMPAQKPSYRDSTLSAYHFIEQVGIGENEKEDPFHFAPSLIRQIKATPFQEIGTHTYAHYYCNEEGQQSGQFREDLRAAIRVAGELGVVLRSLVFPRNQFRDEYLKICFEEGITSVRSNPLDWFWQIDSTQSESMWKRLNRGLDAYFPIGKKNTYSLKSIQTREGYPVCLPASRLLRPYRPNEFMLNDFKIQRIKSEMTQAARQGEVYHLWWHPHNFGHHPLESLAALNQILEHYQHLKTKQHMESYSMSELTEKRILSAHESRLID